MYLKENDVMENTKLNECSKHYNVIIILLDKATV